MTHQAMTQGEVRFDGRAILITGAGRGLGRSHALVLAALGAKVVVADNGVAMDGKHPSTAPAESVAAEIKAKGGNAVVCTADLATEAGANQAVDASLTAFGRIDGILHNASTAPNLTTADKLSSEDFDVAMHVNAYAGMWMARAAWPHMVEQKYGRILFTTSSAIFGADGNTPYAAAKAACIGTMRCLAPEGVKHGILVNVVAPAARTRMNERLYPSAFTDWFMETMTPEKVSVGVAYMLSEACNIHGEIFSMGGGRIARILIAESEGVIGSEFSIEEVRDVMPRVMTDTSFSYPKDLTERSTKVASLFGFQGGLAANGAYAVKPIEEA